MLTYFQEYYINMARGVSYIPTQIATVVAVVLLMTDMEWTVRGVARKAVECAVALCAYVLANAVVYSLFGDHQLDKWMLTAFTACYGLLRSKYRPRVRFVRGIVYIAAYMVIFSISEPIGEMLQDLNSDYWSWGRHMTWVTVVVLLFLTVWFLRHFSAYKNSPVNGQFVLLLVVVSVMIIISQVAYFALAGAEDTYDFDTNYKQYNQVVSFILLIIQMLTYYLYYSVVSATRENLNLLTMQHKAAMEKEKFEANRVNYDDLRMLRHELKNHNFYMLSLLEAGDYQDLAEYLYHLTDDETKRLQSFDCGNYLVDVVMNHAMHVAEEKGVSITPQIIVPHKLPYEDTDLCSLLSNLMDNAIEAAEQAKTEDKSVTISILPRQDYLFIHVTNSVDLSIPAQQRLTLKTTKKRYDIHGYGTKVIRAVAEKYRGSVNFSMVDNRFVADVMLELANPEEQEEEKS